MRRWMTYAAGLAAMALMAGSGCEWDASEEDNYWSSRWSWVDFSGNYRYRSGVNVIPGEETDLETFSTDEVVGVGNNLDTQFSGVLANRPIVPGSLTITAPQESFVDQENTVLQSSEPGNVHANSINYSTGGWQVQFTPLTKPSGGAEIIASYSYYLTGDDDGGSTDGEIRLQRLIVNQNGNVLSFTDNNGREFSGKMGRLSTAGGDERGTTSGQVVANFEVTGSNVKIVGTFEGQYTAPDPEEGRGYGTLVNRFIRGTWINDAGETGNFEFSAAQ